VRIVLASLVASLLLSPVLATEAPRTMGVKTVKAESLPDSAQLELELQRMPWEQFKAVISAVPKMKADVDAYGSAGWQYVKARYKTHAWKKNIDKLDAAQRKQLADLIQKTKSAGIPAKSGS